MPGMASQTFHFLFRIQLVAAHKKGLPAVLKGLLSKLRIELVAGSDPFFDAMRRGLGRAKGKPQNIGITEQGHDIGIVQGAGDIPYLTKD